MAKNLPSITREANGTRRIITENWELSMYPYDSNKGILDDINNGFLLVLVRFFDANGYTCQKLGLIEVNEAIAFRSDMLWDDLDEELKKEIIRTLLLVRKKIV